MSQPVRILDLDGSLVPQHGPFSNEACVWIPATTWGPRIRLSCTFRMYQVFRRWLEGSLGEDGPAVTLYGSGDFHHITLALLERVAGPFNLLVLDKHPDWMKGIPFLHCGTWLHHALRMSNLNRVFHCGGERDFDNGYRSLAPWGALESGRIVVFPARRRFRRGRWKRVSTRPLLTSTHPVEAMASRLVDAFREDLGRMPLYVSIDKDVLTSEEAAVNWDSGLLTLDDAVSVLRAFLGAARGRLAGADILGDWSPVLLATPLNRLCHRLDHPSPFHEAANAAERNGRANAKLLQVLRHETA